MLECSYDNHFTCCRELWIDGRLCAAASISLLYHKQMSRQFRPFWKIPWVDGQVQGDPYALVPSDV